MKTFLKANLVALGFFAAIVATVFVASGLIWTFAHFPVVVGYVTIGFFFYMILLSVAYLAIDGG